MGGGQDAIFTVSFEVQFCSEKSLGIEVKEHPFLNESGKTGTFQLIR